MVRSFIMLSLAGMAATACTSTTSLNGSQELTPRLVANQPGDADMSCEALKAEIGEMDVLMAQADQNARNAEASGATASAAAGVATNAALYSGALGRVPGLGFAANAAGGLARQNAQAEAERQAENARTAELRRTALMGIHAGKGC